MSNKGHNGVALHRREYLRACVLVLSIHEMMHVCVGIFFINVKFMNKIYQIWLYIVKYNILNHCHFIVSVLSP